MKTQQEAYAQASRICETINDMYKLNPIDSNNARPWMIFCRTIVTHLDIINQAAYKELKAKPKDGESG